MMVASRLWALLFVGLLSTPAQATVVSGSLNFIATTFSDLTGSPPIAAPIDPVTGTVTFSFDNSASFADVTSGLTVSINLPGTLGPGMTYIRHQGGQSDLLVVGDLLGSVVSVGGGSNDWYLVIPRISTTVFPVSPISPLVAYSTVESIGTPSHIFVSAPAPEPPTMALVALSGLALFGAIRAQRRA